MKAAAEELERIMSWRHADVCDIMVIPAPVTLRSVGPETWMPRKELSRD